MSAIDNIVRQQDAKSQKINREKCIHMSFYHAIQSNKNLGCIDFLLFQAERKKEGKVSQVFRLNFQLSHHFAVVYFALLAERKEKKAMLW